MSVSLCKLAMIKIFMHIFMILGNFGVGEILLLSTEKFHLSLRHELAKLIFRKFRVTQK